MADFESTVCRWHPQWEFIPNTFARQALPMAWDYAELIPLAPILSGTFKSMFGQVLEVIKDITQSICSLVNSSLASTVHRPPSITHASATRLPYPDSYFDAVLTDPPYYYSMTYADLSDFFYVWLKRTIGDLYPDLFSLPLTPKTEEIIEMHFWDKTSPKDKTWFENKLRQSFIELNRVLKPNGIAVVVYAHSTTEGWEAVINALLDSNLVIAAAWPINTEMKSRLVARESAALASSIYIVARKAARQPIGFYSEVRQELRRHLNAKLQRLWEEGIGGADFFIAAIGSAIEVFGKYEKVMDFEGNLVRADRLLEEVRAIATDYAVRQILHNGFAAEISALTRFYVLWRWNYGEALVPFDEANKLAHSCGLDLAAHFGKGGCIRKEKEFVRLLGPQLRKLDDLDDPRDLIDVLHKVLLLWEKSARSEMVKALAESGLGRSEAFYRVAQAISETLPIESKEKKLLDGFLAGRERVQKEVEEERQERLL